LAHVFEPNLIGIIVKISFQTIDIYTNRRHLGSAGNTSLRARGIFE